MDDFLHNLRSGKLKQAERGRRDYGDYKGPQRRVTNERRKTDYYAKVTNENFALIKETLDAIADTQKRIVHAMEKSEHTQVRIAGALESIARRMGHNVDVENTGTQSVAENKSRNGQSDPEERFSHDLPVDESHHPEGDFDLIETISAMRDQGESWEKIARHFDELDIPTISGKGKWRGPAVKKYWMANA